ncbi:MAG: nucleotidyl transferase AbiEii/AbiGii toxin family protein [Acidobacteria bacterium]|nr:nucleotidyl transferase AbiEii/AbiGii toxin family protein [Acidobacteriota bacterium]
MIPEPQRAYTLELLAALGPVANEFVVAGAQAMKFTVQGARATKDIDFILDVIGLQAEPLKLADVLRQLGYAAVEGARNFQFEKPIPGSAEKMRIEFMAPEEFRRKTDFRVDVQEGIHARACAGGTIALAESDLHNLAGTLPNGETHSGRIRVTRPHALVMLKLLALYDRYHNIRGPQEARHDREEAQTHSADIVAIVAALPDIGNFKRQFAQQFLRDPELGMRVMQILSTFFRETTSPGLLVYAEYVAAGLPVDPQAQDEIRQELGRAQALMSSILPSLASRALAEAIDDSCDLEKIPTLVEDYLSGLENSGIAMEHELALQLLPSEAFGGAIKRGDTFIVSASEAVQKVSAEEATLLRAYLASKANMLRANETLKHRFPHALQD